MLLLRRASSSAVASSPPRSSLVAAWLDGIEAGWGIPVALAAFVAIWMAILQIAYVNADLHPDTIEAWTFGRTFAWNGLKHPPLMNWVVGAYTTVFPATDWSLQLLAMLNAAIALWVIDLIVRRFAGSDKRAVALLLLLLLPVYQFLGQRFNANSVLFAVWPLAVYCFLRSFETRQIGWAVAAGLAAALAILGKYYSVFLIGAFAGAALLHPWRWRYFMSPAPWVSIASGGLLLAPHIHSMFAAGVSPLHYALAAHGGIGLAGALGFAALFVLGIAAKLALPLLAWTLTIRSRIETYPRHLGRQNAGLLLLTLVAVGTVALPPIATIAMRSSITDLWAAPGLFLFIVVAGCAAGFELERRDIARLAIPVCVITLGVLLAAPLHAYYRNTHPYNEGRSYFRLASRELTRHWREISARPLATVSGDDLAMAMSFYGDDRPRFLPPRDPTGDWPIPSPEVLAAGWATMCLPEELTCLVWVGRIAAITPSAVPLEFTVTPSLLNRPGIPVRIVALLVPPAGGT